LTGGAVSLWRDACTLMCPGILCEELCEEWKKGIPDGLEEDRPECFLR
jgi:hypothetical protein